MKIIIAGGTGALGQYLVKKLEKEHQIFILTRSQNKKISTSVKMLTPDPFEANINNYKVGNIYPAEVENALLSHPQIADATVIGIPDDKWGEATKAFIVQTEGDPLDEAEVISFVRTQIAGYKCPKTVEHISELPRNPSGKILRKDLRAPYWEGKERNVS